MKKITQLIFQSILTGITIASTIFILVKLTEKYDDSRGDTKSDSERVNFEVSEIRMTKTATHPRMGRIATVTFRVSNPDKLYVRSPFIDIEFFDKEGVFIFGSTKDTTWHPILHHEKDNLSVDVRVPETIDVTTIDKIEVQIYDFIDK